MNWNVQPVRKVAAWDLALCRQVNRACGNAAVRRFFCAISWLGNGKLWYGLMVLLPVLHGETGLAVSLQMALAGILGVVVYKTVKHLTHRPRPFVQHHAIVVGAEPLDQFSFPSGHTLHAVMFTMLVAGSFPFLGALLLPFTLLTAASRVVLGLHYPTDVLLGAAIGAALAISMPAIPVP
jgi:undecaprenyl-diphosphatase